jgi:hypothetical protein
MDRSAARSLAWALENLFDATDVKARNMGTKEEPIIMLSARIGGTLAVFQSVDAVKAALATAQEPAAAPAE